MTSEFQPGDRIPPDREMDRENTPDDHALAHEDTRGSDRSPKEREGVRKAISGVHFSAPFIRRPVATFLLSFAIILAGAAAYKLLPVSSLPQIEFPVIAVGANFPGADPETMASAIATPLERQFSRIAGVNQMTSSSGTGNCSIVLQFDLTRDIDGAARDVQAAINAARSQLPANLPSNPTYRKINPSDAPIMILALTSDTLTVPQLYDAADSVLAQKLASVHGVGQTFVGGSSKPAVRIEANPAQLTNYGIGLDSLRAAIATINVLQPTGYLNGDGPQGQRWSIDTTDQLFGAAAYGPLIIATGRGPVSNAAAANGLQSNVASATTALAAANSATATGPAASGPATRTTTAATTAAVSGTGTASAQIKPTSSNVTTPVTTGQGIVRISDVANVINSVEDIHTAGMFNLHPAILVVIFKSPGSNIIDTVDRIQKMLPNLQASIPPSIKLQVALDRTATIRASVKDITRTMVITIFLVILVVFFFLREVRSTLIPAVSVPLSLLGTFGVMYLLGYTLDNLSLMALTISTGFVVDDAIVVIENISRHLEEGLTPYEAAMKGSAEIGFTVLSMSVSLIAVFIPILLMGGIVGRLFREFAVTLSVAILVSLAVSLTTTPMLSAKFLEPHSARKHGRIYRLGERFFDWMVAEYTLGLKWVLRHQVLVLLITIGTFILNIYLFILVPKGFFPQQDTGRLGGRILGQQDVSFDSMKSKAIEMTNIVKSDPGVLNVMTNIGGGGPGGSSSNSANMFIFLKSPQERAKSGDTSEVVINRLRPKLSRMPGVQTYLQSQQELNIGGRGSATQYQYTLQADSTADLNLWSPRMMAAMMKTPELRDVATDQLESGLQATLVIDRDTASRLGITPLAIDNILSTAFGQRQVSTTYRPLNQYHVVMEVAPQFQQDPGAIRQIYVKNSSGKSIPLSAITHFEMHRIPLAVNHQGLTPAATLSFNLAPGIALSQASEAIDRARNSIGMPASISGGFQGSAQAFQQSLSSEPVLILLALTTVYIVLGMLYESFIHPLTILSTLPSAGVGAILALLITHTDLSVIAIIGIILLIGLVKKNAILMIDFALVAEREHGKEPVDAIYEACLLRFRPIMMTTMAALFGGLPLALGTGVGAELRRPLGITIVGGLIVSQCLTLFTTPVVYIFFDKLRRWLAAMRGKPVTQRLPKGLRTNTPEPAPGD